MVTRLKAQTSEYFDLLLNIAHITTPCTLTIFQCFMNIVLLNILTSYSFLSLPKIVSSLENYCLLGKRFFKLKLDCRFKVSKTKVTLMQCNKVSFYYKNDDRCRGIVKKNVLEVKLIFKLLMLITVL